MDIVTPPPSPTAIFNEGSSDGYYEVEKVVTPVKRIANRKYAKKSKRRRPNPPKAPPQTTPSLEPSSSGMELYHEDQHDETEETQAYAMADEDQHSDTEGYQAYVIAVEERRSGFHALSRNIYVVQGWSTEHKCVKTVSDS